MNGADLDRVISTALAEDLAVAGDVTTLATVDPDTIGTASLVARADGVLSGTEAVAATYHRLDPTLEISWHRADGDALTAGAQLATLTGRARPLLTGERTALNLLGHLSGIATRTRELVRLVAGTHARIIDTRKTTPGLRALEKQAVVHGGGANHRFGLHDAILVKDNHIEFAGGLHAVLERLAARSGHLVRVEVEVDTLDQLATVLDYDAARIGEGLRPVVHAVLLDNMAPDEVAKGVADVRAHPAPMVVEVSGGITEESVRDLARCGVDVISCGALTHSVTTLDIGLDVRPHA